MPPGLGDPFILFRPKRPFSTTPQPSKKDPLNSGGHRPRARTTTRANSHKVSENIDVTTTLTAVDHASPIIAGFVKSVRKLEQSVKKFNVSFEAFSKKSFSES